MRASTSLSQENQKRNRNRNQMEILVEEEQGLELEALSTNQLLNYIIYDALTPSSTPATNYRLYPSPPPQITNSPPDGDDDDATGKRPRSTGAGGKRKRRSRAKACKSEKEAETRRMTHITVERNRRKLMNEHLAVLRSLMPESYVQRGDQASIVGGAIEYVKELEHLLQTLEAQKFILHGASPTSSSYGNLLQPPPFSQFFSYPQYTWTTQINNNNNNNNDDTNHNSSMVNNNYKCTDSSLSRNDQADIEVSLIETHANVRILSRRSFSQLSKMVSAFQNLSLSILHLNVTTLEPLVLYSISAKVEEGCQLTSADDIARAVNHMLRIIEQEAALC